MSFEKMTLEERTLPIPAQIDAAVETKSLELARLWWDGMRPQMTVRAALTDHRDVGAMLAEAAWHNADKYAAQQGGDRDAFLHDIRAAFTKMLDDLAPGSRPKGAA